MDKFAPLSRACAVRESEDPIIRSHAWRFEHLFHAPHRLAFMAAAAVLALSSLWWATVVLSSSEGLAVRWALSPSLAHSVVMTFGFMPLFFTGFLFTAGPRWLSLPPVEARSLLPHILPMVSGWIVFLLSAHGRDPAFGHAIGAIGLGAVTVGWIGISRRFAALVRASRDTDTVHARIVAGGCIVGAAALCVGVLGLASADDLLVRVATRASLWAFIGLVFAAVSHRMIPFFSAAAAPLLDAWRPRWLLWTLCTVFAVEALLSVADVLAWRPSDPTRATIAFAEVVAGVGLAVLAVRWGLVQSLRIRLLAMLHVGFTWLGLGLMLSGASRWLGSAADPSGLLGLAPLHAYTMGFLGSTMFAMVTRVSSGHGGRTVAADDFIWRLFWVLQLAIVSRVAASTVAAPSAWSVALLASAAVGWAGVSLAWGLRYGTWFGTPRPDGRPG